jgi:hypothetical protein
MRSRGPLRFSSGPVTVRAKSGFETSEKASKHAAAEPMPVNIGSPFWDMNRKRTAREPICTFLPAESWLASRLESHEACGCETHAGSIWC